MRSSISETANSPTMAATTSTPVISSGRPKVKRREPVRVSMPAPPSSLSSPAPPLSLSLPARPSKVSAASLPNSESLPVVPVMTRLKMKLLAVRVLGADHPGYVGRLKAMAACAGDDPDHNIEVLIGQLVKIMRGTEEVRLSKRAGPEPLSPARLSGPAGGQHPRRCRATRASSSAGCGTSGRTSSS